MCEITPLLSKQLWTLISFAWSRLSVGPTRAVGRGEKEIHVKVPPLLYVVRHWKNPRAFLSFIFLISEVGATVSQLSYSDFLRVRISKSYNRYAAHLRALETFTHVSCDDFQSLPRW